MEEKNFKCPSCKIGELVSETIEEPPNGERTEIYGYSCGHRHFNVICPTIGGHVLPSGVFTKLKSGEKIGNQPKYEIRERHAKDDIDNPDQPVETRIYKCWKGSQKIEFHFIQYATGVIKHVHCKTCELEYNVNKSTEKLDDLFYIELQPRATIECLRCHAKFVQ